LEQEAIAALISEAGQSKSEEKGLPMPLLMKNAVPGLDRFGSEEAKFKYDVSLRPDETSMDAYDRISVEDYGMGMLLGMGWKPGDPVGSSNKQVVEPIEFIPRGSKLGLGATPVLPNGKEKKFIKPGETREQKPQMGVALGPDGKVRHYKSINERLIPVHRLQLRTNALVEIVNGVHRRLYGRVANYDEKGNDSKIQVRLNLSQEVVLIPKESLEVLDEDATPEDHPAFQMKKTFSFICIKAK